MGIDKGGNVMPSDGTVPSFGAAADGDADRNVSQTQSETSPSSVWCHVA